jgi:hypothetical protein
MFPRNDTPGSPIKLTCPKAAQGQRQQIEQALRQWPASLRYAMETIGAGNDAAGQG